MSSMQFSFSFTIPKESYKNICKEKIWKWRMTILLFICTLCLLPFLSFERVLGFSISRHNLNILKYADDTMLMVDTERTMWEILDKKNPRWIFKKVLAWIINTMISDDHYYSSPFHQLCYCILWSLKISEITTAHYQQQN